MEKNPKKVLTVEEQLRKFKKRFYILLAGTLVFVALTGIYLYSNYDYLAFKHFFTSFYIYTDSLDSVFKKEIKKDVKGNYYAYLDDLAISLITKRIREENNDRYTYLFTPESLNKYIQSEKQEAQQTEVKALDDKTNYLKLTNFSTYTQKFMEENNSKLKSRKNLIIDLRDDPGGDIDVMVNIAGMFIPRKSIVATDRMRFFHIVYKSKSHYLLKYDKIMILQNKNTASASENLIAALRDNLDNVTLIGEKTFGKGIGQYTLPLKRGFAVKATILQWYTPNGVNIQGNGIDPDIEYTDKNILEYAQDLLSK
jgi:Periplasmic protease